MTDHRQTAMMDGEFVLFLIGMRINRVWKVHRWVPVVLAMGRMLRELHRNRALGFLHYEMWGGRTLILVQYWQSMAQLQAYAKARDAAHLPAWAAFNRQVGGNGDVGIWHETYHITPGHYETVYANMPPFGLGRAGRLVPATGRLQGAAGRLHSHLGATDTARD